MESSMSSNSGGVGSFFELLIIGVLIALVVTAVGALGGLPLTKHAQESHIEQTWNPESIRDFMIQGRCIPKTYSCAALDFDVAFCEIKPGLSIGLFIGRTVKNIISGFSARTSYWESRCN